MTKNITNELGIEQTQTLRTQYDETNHAGSKNKISNQQKRKSAKKDENVPMWATEESGSGTSAELVLGCNNVWTSLWAADRKSVV